ncbi:MAG TPA: hypothetical protein ENF21_07105 [Bacteroidetes bacterium]|nr:hypothetical protein [Bacteroidota bacterium]
MVLLPRYTFMGGVSVTQLLGQEEIEKNVERTRKSGREPVQIMDTSAWYVPGLPPHKMVKAIVMDQHRILPVCAGLNGEYGLENLFMGVKLGRNGMEEIIKIELNQDEKELLQESARAVKEVMKVLDDMKLFEGAHCCE